MEFPPAVFITGTDTNVGKTVVSAILTLGLNAGYWKPIQSGLLPCTDSEWIQEITELNHERFLPEAYKLTQPLSPHLSARADQVSILTEQLALPAMPQGMEHLIVEGAGGVLVPITPDFLMIDLIEQYSIPVIVVARSALGTINHTLLTLGELRRRGLTVLGVVMNGAKNEGNKQSIEQYGKTKVLAEIEPMEPLDRKTLLHAFQTHFGRQYASKPSSVRA